MKKKLFGFMIAATLICAMTGCANKKAVNVENEATEQTNETGETDTLSEKSPDQTGTQTGLRGFANGFDMLSGEDFEVLASYSEDTGITSSVKGRSGTAGYFLTNDDTTLIRIDYENETNELYVASYRLDDAGELEGVSVVPVDDAIFMSDNARVCAGNLSFSDLWNALMLEFRGTACTYADGVTYRIVLIEIGEDGQLSVVMDQGLAGSGDEDITSDIREEFNATTGLDVSQKEMEDAFYYGNLLLTQYDATIVAGYSYQSEASKRSDEGDWDGANEIAQKLYALSDGDDAISWATGTFE